MFKKLFLVVVGLWMALTTVYPAFAQSGAGRVIEAQQSRSHVLRTADKASIVLEGRVVAQRGFWDPKHGIILTVNTIEVYTLLKGRPLLTKKKYVEVITLGGTVGDEGMGWIDYDEIPMLLNAIGLFFLSSYTTNGIKPALGKAHYLQASSGSESFWRYDGSPWTGNENVAHVPEKGLYRDIPASIHVPLAAAYGCPMILVPGFDAAHFASYNPFPKKQPSGPPAKRPIQYRQRSRK